MPRFGLKDLFLSTAFIAAGLGGFCWLAHYSNLISEVPAIALLWVGCAALVGLGMWYPWNAARARASKLWTQEVTPPELDYTVGPIAAILCIALGLGFAIDGSWRMAAALLLTGFGQLFHAWRFWRRRNKPSEK
jgi:hypothetical protein